MNDEDFIIEIKNSNSRKKVCENLGISINSNNYKKINKIIKKYNICVKHFKPNGSYLRIKYKKIEKKCPICNKIFLAYQNSPREKTTCSISCSNTYFRSGKNNANYIPLEKKTKKALQSWTGYRNLFSKDEFVCSRCGYKEFSCSVQVHHIDENRLNNKKDNLKMLCANCHLALHAKKWNI